MAKYIVKRILLAILTIFIVSVITFFAMNLIPGGPFNTEKAMSPAVIAALNERYGLDDPVPVQYVNYMKRLLTELDFGVCLKTGRDVWVTITTGLKVSARLGLSAAALALVCGVVLGSIERFIGVITEHFAGAFPAWLSPVQVKVLPVTDRAAEYADSVAAQLDAQGFRVEVDHRSEKIGKKIREATLEKIPYMLVVGDRDMENGTVSPRRRSGEDLGAMALADFAARLKEEVDTKALDVKE